VDTPGILDKPLEKRGKVEMLAVKEHERWMDDYVRAGWVHAPGAKQNHKKTHPSLAPWSQLADDEKEKDRDTIRSLPLLGISGIANLLASIKLARAFGFTEDDVVVTVLTDSLELYGSRLAELAAAEGPFDREAAMRAHAVSLAGQGAENVLELTVRERRRIHNLKYYTWVEQQGKRVEDLDAQWDDPALWRRVQLQAPRIDEAITEFNREAGIAR